MTCPPGTGRVTQPTAPAKHLPRRRWFSALRTTGSYQRSASLPNRGKWGVTRYTGQNAIAVITQLALCTLQALSQHLDAPRQLGYLSPLRSWKLAGSALSTELLDSGSRPGTTVSVKPE
jgi:hypothetical protein